MLRKLALSIVLACTGPTAHAAYPEKPIRMILPSAAGGSVDILMRVLITNRIFDEVRLVFFDQLASSQ